LKKIGGQALSAAHQNFMFGNPAKPNEKTLDQLAKEEFYKQYADEAQEIEVEENKRVYKRINNDPAYALMMKEIVKDTNRDLSATKHNSTNYGSLWDRFYFRNSIHKVENFVSRYPEKAEAYALQDAQISKSLEKNRNIKEPVKGVSFSNREDQSSHKIEKIPVNTSYSESESKLSVSEAVVANPDSADQGKQEESTFAPKELSGDELSGEMKNPVEEKLADSNDRISFSEEDSSKERTKVIEQKMAEMKNGHPEVLSLCLIGSMLENGTRSEDDAVGFLFFESKEEEIFDQSNNLENDEEFRLAKNLEKNYQDELRSGLSDIFLSKEQIQRLQVVPINKQLIDLGLTKILKAFESQKDYKKAHDAWEKNKPIDYIDEYYKLEPERAQLPLPEQRLSAMFHLEVGGGIKKYRDYLLKRLGEMGEDGERVWQEIINYTEMMEQDLSFGTGKKYPKNLKEAIKVYGNPKE